MLLFFSSSVQAADWQITPRLLFNETFTDNALLTDTNTKSDFISELTPGISLRGEGGRMNVELDYNLQMLRHKNVDQLDNENHQLQANISAELYRQILFVDLSSSISQQLQDNTGVISNSNLTSGGNRSDVMTYTLSPYIRHHFGPYAEMESRFEVNQVFNDAGTSSVSNSQSDLFSTHFSSGRRFARMPWSVDYSNREIDSDTGTNSKFKRINGQLTYPLSRGYSLTGTVSHETNDFATGQTSTGGFGWTVGLIWTPGPRTNLEARIGDRFFGSTVFVSGSHRLKHSVFSVDYTEEIQTLNDIQTGQRLIQTTDAFGEAIFDPNAISNLSLATNTPTLQRDETTINRNLSMSYAYSRKRNTLRLSLINSLQEFQLTGDEQTTRSLQVEASRQLSRSTTSGIDGNWQVNEFANGARENTLLNAGMYLRLSINKYLDGNLRYNYSQSDSDTATIDHTENSLSAFLTAHF